MLVLVIVAPIAQYMTNITLGMWTSAGGSNSDHKHLYLYVGMCVVYSLLQFLRGWTFAIFFTNASRTLFNKMLKTVLRQQMGWYDSTPTGRIINRFSGDMNMVEVRTTAAYFERC